MGRLRKAKKSRASKSRNIFSKAASSLSSVISRKSSTGPRRSSRRKSPEYWAKKVLVEKLKKRYFRLKFGGR